jgi:predicted PurR-regulated permease PerM
MNYHRLQIYFFLSVFVMTLVLSFFLFRPYLGLMVFAAVLAVLMQPVYRRLLKYFRNPSLASISTVFLTLMLVLVPLLFVFGSLAVEAVLLYGKLRERVSFDAVADTLSRIVGPEQATRIAAEASRAVSDAATYIQPLIGGLTSNIFAIFSNTLFFVLGFFLVLMGMYYILKDGSALKKEIIELSPLTLEDDTAIVDRVTDAIKAVAFGQFVIAIIKGVVGAVAFLLIGLPTPIFWGTMIALTNFVPGIGTAIVTVPFTIYLFATGQFWSALILAIISVLVIGLVDNFLTPQVMRSRIRIHPMLILLSMLGGLSLFGAMGIFFGPIVLSVTMALIGIYKKEFRASVEHSDLN